MRFLYVSLIVSLLSGYTAWAQPTSETSQSVVGSSRLRIVLTDAKQQPIYGATVRLRSWSDSTRQIATITDTAGVALLNLRPDAPYELSVTALGKKLLAQEIRLTNPQSTFRFTLEAQAKTLASVTVSREHKKAWGNSI